MNQFTQKSPQRGLKNYLRQKGVNLNQMSEAERAIFWRNFRELAEVRVNNPVKQNPEPVAPISNPTPIPI